MELEIDPLSTTPIYQQIRDRIVEAIAAGELVRGQSVASVRTLANAFGINPGTVAKAYDALRQEGFLAANAKTGTFVACDPHTGVPDDRFTSEWRARLHTLLAEARARGMSTTDLAHHLELAEGAFTGRAEPEKGASQGPAVDAAARQRPDERVTR